MTHVYDVSERMVVMDRGTKIAEFTRGEISLDRLIQGLQTLARTGEASAFAGALPTSASTGSEGR